ncbi:unnamed protein product [Staurois parvus]|uniref:Uncharacterized protein n=1 Tax=Staurois parvus TaxID=386267 RepID=A0ABN9F5D2_9NEOB|nr:unnamed protein product [Staurois parvus]
MGGTCTMFPKVNLSFIDLKLSFPIILQQSPAKFLEQITRFSWCISGAD